MHTVLTAPSAQSGVPYLRTRSRSPWFRQPLSSSTNRSLCRHRDLQLVQSHVAPSHGSPARALSPLFFQAKSLLLPKPHGKREHLKAVWSSSVWLLCLGLNPRANLPLQPHFRLLPPLAAAASIPVFFQLYWAAIVSPGRHSPMAWSQSSPSSHAGSVTRGIYFPVTSWVEVSPIPLAQRMATAI